MPKKNTLLFLVVIIISFVLMTYQGKKGHSQTSAFLNNLLDNTHKLVQLMTDTIKQPFKKIALREKDNKRLQKYLDELLIQREIYQEAVLENKRLRELLRLRDSNKNYVAAAKVIARNIDYWTNTLTVDKGSKDAIEKNMIAITPKGLAGKIFSVSDSYSNLLLITDMNFSAAVRLQQSRTEGILSGTGSKKCILKYIPYEEEIKTGDIIITSGMDSLFPSGIPVGYVSRIDKKGTGVNFQYIEVEPFQDDNKIEEVLIVK